LRANDKISHAFLNFFLEQDSPLGFTGIEILKDKLLMVLRNLHKEKEEEKVMVDVWCHLGHAYITEVDEGVRYRTCLILSILRSKSPKAI